MHVQDFPVQFAEMAVVALVTLRVTKPTLRQFCAGVVVTRLVRGLAAITVPSEQ